MVMDSMNADIADDPAHRLMINPMDTTSAWPLFRMVSTVLPTRSATSGLKMVSGRPGDFHPEATTERNVTLSRHSALLIQSIGTRASKPSERRARVLSLIHIS